MTRPKTPAATSQPTPQQLNRITSQLRDLNAAYKAVANGTPQGGSAPSSKPGK